MRPAPPHHVGLAHLTRPLVTRTYAAGRAFAQAGFEHGFVVGHRPGSIGSARPLPPGRRASGEFESRIWPRARGRRRHELVAVESRPTRGTGDDGDLGTGRRDQHAEMGRAQQRAAGTTTSPICTSSPAPRTAVPELTSSVSSTSSGHGRATALDHHDRVGPGGSGAPGFMIRIASPGPTRSVGAIPGQRWRRAEAGGRASLARRCLRPHDEEGVRRVHERRYRFERGDHFAVTSRPRRPAARPGRHSRSHAETPQPSPHRAGSRRGERYDPADSA